LIALYEARSKVSRIQVTEYSITFYYSKQTISGVYFPLIILDSAAIRLLLGSIKSSTIILGNINTRFRDPIYQSGEPGLLERLQVFTDFLTETDY
jgi:hypothetical protein